MTDDEESRRRLIEDLWPVPTPPSDMAARVLAAIEAERRPVPMLMPRRRRGPLIAAAASLSALAAGATLVWWLQTRPGPVVEEDGGWIAARRATVNIGARATASMQPGSDLKWSVQKARVRVQQRRGSVFYRVDRGGPFQVTTPAGDVEVTGTCFTVTNAPLSAVGASSLVSVLEGSVNVRTAAGTLRLTPGESARIQRERPPERLMIPAGATSAAHAAELREPPEPAAPGEQPPPESAEPVATRPARTAERPSALLLPASTKLRVFGNPLSRVSLSLPAGKHTGIEVAREPRFRRPVYAGPARAPFVTVPAPERGHLYWRVAGRSELAGHAHFLPEARRTSRPVATVVTEGRPSTTITFQGAPPALTLSFAAAPEARSYQVRIFRVGAAEEPVVERTVSEARCSLPPGVLSDGQYLWTVVPRDDAGRALDKRPLNKLELAYDNARSTLDITRTAKGVVRGVAPLGARLFVNGAPAPVDDKGRFSLRPGPARVLVFRLVVADGSESFWVRNVPGRPARKTL
jgi:hypothetical protein